MSAIIRIPLDIPDVRVLNIEANEAGEYIITVESTLFHATCPTCGRKITKFHGHADWVTLRHLSILGTPVYIRLRPRRYQCPYCPDEPTTNQQLPWHEPNSPNTKPYEEHVLLQLINSTPQDVSLKEGLGYDAVRGIVDRHIAREVDWVRLHAIDVLGLDEVAMRKGRHDYVVIVSARLANGCTTVSAVLPNREKNTVKAFLQTTPKRLQRTIHSVCTDMYLGYIKAAKEVLGSAVVVVDRYHVAQKYRESADALRRKERKRLKQELSEEEYESIKATMWAFRKNSASLTPNEALSLEHLFEHSPQRFLAYTFREELTAIFEQDLTKEGAIREIEDWQTRVAESELTCFDGILTTLDTYMDEITNYFLSRHTSGFVEGVNNKIKVLKHRCYGIFNLGHLFQRLFLSLEGYRQYA
jgi:transposase